MLSASSAAVILAIPAGKLVHTILDNYAKGPIKPIKKVCPEAAVAAEKARL